MTTLFKLALITCALNSACASHSGSKTKDAQPEVTSHDLLQSMLGSSDYSFTTLDKPGTLHAVINESQNSGQAMVDFDLTYDQLPGTTRKIHVVISRSSKDVEDALAGGKDSASGDSGTAELDDAPIWVQKDGMPDDTNGKMNSSQPLYSVKAEQTLRIRYENSKINQLYLIQEPAASPTENPRDYKLEQAADRLPSQL